MIAGNRHAAQDGLGLARGRHLALLQLVANDLVVDLGVKPILVEPDARAAMRAFREGRAKSFVHIGIARCLGVLERDEKATLMWRVVVVIDATPGVDIDGAVGRHRKLPCVPDLVGKDGRAETVRQAQSRIALRTFALRSRPGWRREKPSQATGSHLQMHLAAMSCSQLLIRLGRSKGTPTIRKGRRGNERAVEIH